MAARTKRTTRTARKAATPPTGLQTLRKNYIGAVNRIYKEGMALQAKGRKFALAKANEAKDAMLGAGKTMTARADEARVRTLDAVTHFEKVFEHRVQGAISRLGVPTARDVRALSRQVAQLQQSVDQLRRSRARA